MSQFPTVPMFSAGDQVAPYRHYECAATLYVNAGGLQLPIAYRAVLQGETPRATSRLVQAAEPCCAVAIEWFGVRTRTKPEPPRILLLGDFILAHAAASVMGVSKEANGTDVVKASGWFLLTSTTRPEHAVLPALWTPYDGRYDTSIQQVQQYLYTPAELGFGAYLPGQATTTTQYGNPVLQQTQSGGGKILGENP